MEGKPTVDVLAIRICHTVRDMRGDHQAWIAPDLLRDHLGAETVMAIDAAVAFAAAKGWLAIGGAPAHSVLLSQVAP